MEHQDEQILEGSRMPDSIRRAECKHLKRAAFRFFCISRLYSIAATILILTSIALNCVATFMAVAGKNENVGIAVCSAVSAALLALNEAFQPAQANERCRTISRDLNRLMKDYERGNISEEKKNSRYARIQAKVPIGTCIWLR